jgi:hypothetical protein
MSILDRRVETSIKAWGSVSGQRLGCEFAAPADLPDRLPNKIGVELSTAADHRYDIAVDMKLATHTEIAISTLVMV